MVRAYLQNVPIIVEKEAGLCGGFLTVIGMEQPKGVSLHPSKQKRWKLGAHWLVPLEREYFT